VQYKDVLLQLLFVLFPHYRTRGCSSTAQHPQDNNESLQLSGSKDAQRHREEKETFVIGQKLRELLKDVRESM
jgi:hypothetical protein